MMNFDEGLQILGTKSVEGEPEYEDSLGRLFNKTLVAKKPLAFIYPVCTRYSIRAPFAPLLSLIKRLYQRCRLRTEVVPGRETHALHFVRWTKSFTQLCQWRGCAGYETHVSRPY
jgi:hypothetical protein